MLNFTQLFTRIGTLGKLVSDQQVQAASTLPTDSQTIITQYTTGNAMAYIDSIESQVNSAQNSLMSISGFMQSSAQSTINGMVYADNPLSSNSNIVLSMQEVIRQMIADGQTVQRSDVAATVTANGSNVGNGVIVASVLGADGLMQENSFAENIRASCVADSVTSPSYAGAEVFSAAGEQFYPPFSFLFPAGSGGSTSLSCANASSNNSNNTLLTNGDFENWTSNTPNNWVITVGTAGTQVLESNSFYTGAHSLEIVGDGSTLTALTQVFGSGSGTLGNVASASQYAINCWIQVSAVPAAGVLEIALVDGFGTILQDEQGNNASFTKNLTGATTSWVPFSGVVRTPYVLPSSVLLRVRLSTALSSGKNLFIDRLAMTPMQQVYTGGPSLAAFSGSTNFLVGDFFTVAVTNNRGGSSNGLTFQEIFDRFCNMRVNNLLLPSTDGSPTLPDSLIV